MIDFSQYQPADVTPLREMDLEPDKKQIAAFFDMVFGYTEGMAPFRGFIDFGKGQDGKPYNSWIDLNHEDPKGVLYNMCAYCAANGTQAYVIPGTVASSGEARTEHVQQMQAIPIDIDTGNIAEKADYVRRHLGIETMLVASGGVTDEGQEKRHLWWQLTEVAEGEDLKKVAEIRALIALKAGGDNHFASLHQPIRIAGSVYSKGERYCVVNILQYSKHEYELDDLLERARAMPAMQGIDFSKEKVTQKLGSTRALTSDFSEGGEGIETRFAALSAVIGHEIRLWHEGRQTIDAAWQRVQNYNEARVHPPFEQDRLKREFDALQSKHTKEHGEAAPVASDTFEILSYSQMIDLPPVSWMVEGLIQQNGAALLFGKSNSFKSFLAVDIACSVATGTDWHGHAVKQGHVLYIANEGANGVGRLRIRGWMDQHRIPQDKRSNISMIRTNVFLDRPEDVQRLMKSIAEQIPGGISLVVIDIMKGSISGTENADDVAGEWVAGVQRLVSKEMAVLAIAHTGWADSTRMRGSTHLWGSFDNRLIAEGDKENRTTKLKVERHKDADSSGEWDFELTGIGLGDNETTLVPTLMDPSEVTAKRQEQARSASAGKGKWQKLAIKTGLELIEKTRSTTLVEAVWKDALQAEILEAHPDYSNPRAPALRAIRDLQKTHTEPGDMPGTYVWTARIGENDD